MRFGVCRNTPQPERIPMVEGYNRGPLKNNFVFLLSSKSGGTGLNSTSFCFAPDTLR